MHTHSAESGGHRLPAGEPQTNLVRPPHHHAAARSVSAEVYAHLTEIEDARRRQLEALPPTDLDAVAAAHRGCVERILQEVRTALARLDAGVYGTCAGCAREIPQARLELRPWAVTCATCGSRDRS
jgi:DnaK suppressor protein